jgi:hypothetical protein
MRAVNVITALRPASQSLERLLPQVFLLIAILLGALHTWAASISHSMNPDGIAYRDMGDALLRGDWEMALSAYWSPLYGWILGAVMFVTKPSMRWEFPVVHIVISHSSGGSCWLTFAQDQGAQLIRYRD